MNRSSKVLLRLFLISIFAIFSFKIGNSQTVINDPSGPCDDPQILNCACPESAGNALCPIDSGVYYLLAAGLGYGIIRMRKQRKKNVPA